MITIIFKKFHQYARMKPNNFKFYDIAANLTDNQFSGQYHGKKHHPDDRQEVIKRAKDYGC